MSIKITGTGSALPSLSKTNDQISQLLDTSHEWIFSRTGIGSRHFCEEGLSKLATRAGSKALADANCSPADIDYLLCATFSNEYATPSLACLVQQELGATCPSLDLNAACTGFIYGLEIATALLASGRAKRVLLIAAEAMSHLVDWTKRDISVLFGDGAGAVVLERGEDLLALTTSAIGNAAPLYAKNPQGNCPYLTQNEDDCYMHMDGKEIYKFAVTAMVQDILQVLAIAKITPEAVDYVLPHQANMRILEAAAKRLPIPEEKFLNNMQSKGNTSAASIPILLDEACSAGLIKAGQLLVMSAFGAGLTTGACVIKWSKNNIKSEN
ncbi:MAG: beta-ketoacyl-ACP synthase III [Clostridia bacterium]